MISPARHQFQEVIPYFYPFASYRPHNALEGFDTLSQPLNSDGMELQVCIGDQIT